MFVAPGFGLQHHVESRGGDDPLAAVDVMERRPPAGRYAGILPADYVAAWKAAERPAGSRRSMARFRRAARKN